MLEGHKDITSARLKYSWAGHFHLYFSIELVMLFMNLELKYSSSIVETQLLLCFELTCCGDLGWWRIVETKLNFPAGQSVVCMCLLRGLY